MKRALLIYTSTPMGTWSAMIPPAQEDRMGRNTFMKFK